MAEGRPASSLEEMAKPKSSQKEKRPHQTEGKDVETPALQLSEAQQEPPSAALQTTSSEDREQHLDTVSAEASEISLISISDPQQESDQPLSHLSSRPPPLLAFQERKEPTMKVFREGLKKPRIKLFRSGCSVKVSTEYQGKHSLELSSTAIIPEKPLPRTDQPRSMPVLEHTDKAGNKTKGEDIVYGGVEPIKQWQKVTASIPSVVPAREAATKLHQTQEFFQIKQLPKPPSEVR